MMSSSSSSYSARLESASLSAECNRLRRCWCWYCRSLRMVIISPDDDDDSVCNISRSESTTLPMLLVVLRSDDGLPLVADRMDGADVCTLSFRFVLLLELHVVPAVVLSRRHRSVPPSSMSTVRRRRRYAYLFRAALWYRSPSRNRGWGAIEFGFFGFGFGFGCSA